VVEVEFNDVGAVDELFHYLPNAVSASNTTRSASPLLWRVVRWSWYTT